MIDDFIATLNSEHATTATPVVGADFRRINQQLLERFFRTVKQATGNWVYDEYRWHAYTFNHETALSGDAVFNRHAEQSVQLFSSTMNSTIHCLIVLHPLGRMFAHLTTISMSFRTIWHGYSQQPTRCRLVMTLSLPNPAHNVAQHDVYSVAIGTPVVHRPSLFNRGSLGTTSTDSTIFCVLQRWCRRIAAG